MRIIGNEHVQLALEVAIKGNHSILIIGNRRNTIEDKEPLSANVALVSPCPCGNHLDARSDARIECTCILEEVLTHRREFPHCDIKIELVRPRFDDLISAKLFKGISEPVNQLLRIAYDKLRLTVQDIVDVLAVAKTISVLDGSTEIKPQHVAEAIQYKSLRW